MWKHLVNDLRGRSTTPARRGPSLRRSGGHRFYRIAAVGLRAASTTALGLTAGCNLFTIEQDIELGTQAFQEVVSQHEIAQSGPAVEQARRVTERLIVSAKELDPDTAQRFPWEVVVIKDDKMVNAFCLPGGKMAVYTGILPVTQDDTGLAVVMGHEIAHATKRHGTKRVSRTMPLELAISVFAQSQDQAQMANVLAQLGLGLPWGRSDELEADRIGLMYMAKAGYDPRQAVDFWKRMAELSGGQGEGLAEYFSTHPSNTRRIEQIEEMLPEALELYQASMKSLAR